MNAVANSTKSNKFNSTFNNAQMGATLRDPQLRSLDEAAITDRTDAAKRRNGPVDNKGGQSGRLA